ncbi:alkaline phosphatase family protein [Streptomyces virginiae]|uniref:alkaline phosphatase family protein n=1 Tax=Streptomyces virginiae TaxID=1961 RepID=UPI00224DAB99|nr:alkaline phosphatase family protein [Streptomyces virginiae]MCX4962891.1 alkaline phosphatase family protein [Streptomyces virginiae]MCX5179154.1 alkaline phosphatase family protein [Streptomyces virginiae]
MSPVLPGRRAIAATAVTSALIAATVAATPAAAAANTDKVLVIGIDGAVLDRVKAAAAPNLNGLMAQGLTARSTLYAGPMAATSSGPGWSTIATGVWPDKHGVKDNSFIGKNYAAHPDFLTRIENAKPALNTYAAADWEPITSTDQNGPIFSSKVDKRLSLKGDRDGYRTEDPKIAAAAAAELRDQNPDAAFVYLGEIDAAGHSYGAASQQYLDTIARVDTLVGQLLTAVKNRPTYAQENWKILVSTDHGHTDSGGHGGSTIQERGTFVIAKGAGIPAGSVRSDVRLVDVAATALAQVGVSGSGLDGVPLNAPDDDPFDTLRPNLQARVDETGIPAGVKGFTHTPPAGWSVDNSRMGTGGVTEWAGWAFATDEFWSQSQRDQWRELNVRSRDVFAVADSDEWDDKSHTGTFDSTLVTPKWAVSGGSTRNLTFQTHYRHEAGQTAQVLVSYNGAAPTVVKTYTADAIAKAESLALQVPAGATDVQVRFRYSGTNNWFWTVDNVRLS